MKQLIIFIAFICINKLSFAQAAAASNTYALIIGVAKYKYPEIPQLQFANRDAAIFAEFLRSKAGGAVPGENIRLLTDSAATTGAVYNAIYWLKNSCNKNDKVYIYFSGHGDLENITMYNNGFLICWDSPQFNYVGLALSIDYLNDIANTISVEKGANVILITDACHSGKLTEKRFKGNFLAADQLRKLRNNEIRITSSSASELSNERSDWGGGRGVFSYYLVYGLKGLASKTYPDKVTLEDIRNYLDSALKNDLVLKADELRQTPVVKGNDSFILTDVDPATLDMAKKEIKADTQLLRKLMVSTVFPGDDTQESPQACFYRLLKQLGLETATDSFGLYKYSKDKITFVLIDSMINHETGDINKTKLRELRQTLINDRNAFKQFNNTLAIAFDEAGQQIITQYLRGDAAELERRRYYNAAYSSYDVYPRMFQIALDLIDPGNTWYCTNIRVKLHYFTGVADRLKLPLTEPTKQKPLVEKALAEQKKALALEKYAAYIYNELGVLYMLKNSKTEAEKYFKIAALRAPNWAIPRSNLADLYTITGQLDNAVVYADSVSILQPDFYDIYTTWGLISEKKGALLQAEAAFYKNIRLNNGHFLPFERLGYVYMNSLRFPEADSMLYAAATRKKDFFIEDMYNPVFMKLPKINGVFQILCMIDSAFISSKDIFGQFALGYTAYRDYDLAKAERAFKRVISLDKNNPLAYHYLGMTLADQQRWPEAELVFKLAVKNHLPDSLWLNHYHSLFEQSSNSTEFIIDPCSDSCYSFGYYNMEEDYLLLAQVYENWGYYSEAITFYYRYINADPNKAAGYRHLANLFRKTGKFYDAEILLNEYQAVSGKGLPDLVDFYREITDSFPDNAEWHLKAGIFNYILAKKQPEQFMNDRKKTDELTGEIVYANVQRRQMKIPGPALPRLIPYGTPIHVYKFRVPLHPFTNGIHYLKKAMANTQYEEMVIADINTKIGDLYNWQGLPDSAIFFYKTALSLDPGDNDTRNKLADMYNWSCQVNEALAQLDTLSAYKSLNYDKQLLLVKFYMRDGRLQEAEKLLNDAEKRIPFADIRLTVLKGELAVLNKDLTRGIEIFHSLYLLNKRDSIALYNLARSAALSGKKQAAWKWLDMALEAGFNYTYVLKYDPALKMLRQDPKWTKTIPRIKGKDYMQLDLNPEE